MVTAFILLLASPAELSCTGGGRHLLSPITVSSCLGLSGKAGVCLVGCEPNASLLPGNLCSCVGRAGEAQDLQTRLQVSTTAASGPKSCLFLSLWCLQSPPAPEECGIWDFWVQFPVQVRGSVSPACSEGVRWHQDSLAVEVACCWTLTLLSHSPVPLRKVSAS